jgi:hypothetical protein
VRLFVQSERSSAGPTRELVTVCRDCGEFEVRIHKGGTHVVSRFTLPTWELVAAAGKYALHLDKSG